MTNGVILVLLGIIGFSVTVCAIFYWYLRQSKALQATISPTNLSVSQPVFLVGMYTAVIAIATLPPYKSPIMGLLILTCVVALVTALVHKDDSKLRNNPTRLLRFLPLPLALAFALALFSACFKDGRLIQLSDGERKMFTGYAMGAVTGWQSSSLSDGSKALKVAVRFKSSSSKGDMCDAYLKLPCESNKKVDRVMNKVFTHQSSNGNDKNNDNNYQDVSYTVSCDAFSKLPTPTYDGNGGGNNNGDDEDNDSQVTAVLIKNLLVNSDDCSAEWDTLRTRRVYSRTLHPPINNIKVFGIASALLGAVVLALSRQFPQDYNQSSGPAISLLPPEGTEPGSTAV